ncbi:MAG: sensor histidine kinase [Eubacterium sp.]|nr:sensor histidine kinase [Eubacterium sp.]
MNIKNYLLDKKADLILLGMLLFIITWFLRIFKTNTAVTVIVVGLFILVEVVRFIMDYNRRAGFYNELVDNTKRLDQAYLVLETLNKPEFIEGEMVYETLYDINKSMNENVNSYIIRSRDFREYIELWIHEVKLPLSSMGLKLHNLIESGSKNEADTEIYKKLQAEVRRLDAYVDQVLYYSRSENMEKDYHIAKVPLSKIVHETAMEHRESLRDNDIDLRIENIEDMILNTDQKWFVFILGQLISNSIKYRRDSVESYVKIYADGESHIYIEDNGVGIPEKDIKRVFDKSYTGDNGVGKAKSTGMGLYIVKTLCDKLGHEISIESEDGEWTRVCITVKANEFYEVM